ncbi:polysaccharide pyruvyl transferase family protein [Eubacterium oxidoreducens]|uniref:Polysaccharide pyruvyl transferase family protein WcaK n=1 Tax=Eubacterium oxidoreducens TaxID=1732 RepID=A0A1G6AE97_EUBOX|nr:polysaccharide pyruvyl transferase family protein [Eubacterium oxidoreducens]SDB06741.1 Polysaccharide pyruvyl transferase family protein WcaK [Eubacterium oxidoreducens]
MKNIVLFPHGGSGNHGCEALVRTTAGLMNKYPGQVFSDRPEEDYRYIGEDLIEIHKSKKTISRLSSEYVKGFIGTRIKKNPLAFDEIGYQPVIDACNQDTLLLSIGGDNYCYGDNDYLYMVNRIVRAKGTKTVLWGCSIGPENLTDKMREDLKGYDMIVTRESLSYENLKQINPNTVLCADPAFTMEMQEAVIPDGLGNNPYICINVSPMIQSKEAKEGITLANYRTLMQGILDHTNFDIALLPHVVWEANDDRKPLMQLYEEYKDSGRIYMIEDQNCLQLKSIISKSEVTVAARTHASVAAYSTAVPTLVVGYSIKARGIAKDLFGTEEGYVIPVQSLDQEEDLYQAFVQILNRKEEIRDHLTKILPEYVKRARSAAELVWKEVE